MPTFYHAAALPLGGGSIIMPGNWGRVLKTYSTDNGALNVNVCNEMFLELTRRAVAPHKPSRLECIFLTPTLEGARAYQQMHSKTSLIYEIEPLIPDAPTHTGDYNLAIQPFRGTYVQSTFDRCQSYWVDPPTSDALEVLMVSPVRVIRFVDP